MTEAAPPIAKGYALEEAGLPVAATNVGEDESDTPFAERLKEVAYRPRACLENSFRSLIE